MKRINIMFATLLFGGFTYWLYSPEVIEPKISFEETQERIEEVAVLTMKVTATMYNAVEAQCDADPLTTAGMYQINPKKATQHKWVALSRDLLQRWGGEFTYGDKIRISGTGKKDGVYTIVDTMNPRFKNRIDILETIGTPLYKYKNVTITKVV